MGKQDEALKSVNTAITHKPDDGAFFYHRAAILSAMGKAEEALIDEKKAIKLGYTPEPWEKQLFNL